MWKYLFAIAVSAAVIATSVYLFRHREEMFRPDARKLGGTRIAFAVEDGTPDEAYLTAMRRRFDPRGRLGVVVRQTETEVEIVVPRGPTHDDTVARVVRLAGRPGKFAFVPVANTTVDEGVATHIQATYAGKKSKPRTGPPPPPMNSLGGREFSLSTAGANPRQYRWVRLGEAATTTFQLDPASLVGGNIAEKSSVDRAARNGALLRPNALPEAMLLVSRLPDEAGPAFFLLVRDASDEEAIAPDHVRSAEIDSESYNPNTIRLRLDGEGARRMTALKQLQFGMLSARPRSTPGSGTDYYLALALDDRIVAFPFIPSIQGSEAMIHIGSSDERTDDLVCLLRGPLTEVRLNAKPTRVETLEPKR